MKVVIKATKRGEWDLCYTEDNKGYLLHRGHGKSHEYVWWCGNFQKEDADELDKLCPAQAPHDSLIGPCMIWVDSTDCPKPGPDVRSDNIPPGEITDMHEEYEILMAYAQKLGLSVCFKCGGIGTCNCAEIAAEKKSRKEREEASRKIYEWGTDHFKYQGAPQ